MFEETGQRPVVYNNKCGQMCGVSVTRVSGNVRRHRIYFVVLRQRGSFEILLSRSGHFVLIRSMRSITTRSCIRFTKNGWRKNFLKCVRKSVDWLLSPSPQPNRPIGKRDQEICLRFHSRVAEFEQIIVQHVSLPIDDRTHRPVTR